MILHVEAETLTPLSYHSVAIPSGTATIPDVITDSAICFGLANALGMMRATTVLPSKGYLRDLVSIPFRSSVFSTIDDPRLLAPLIRRNNLDAEGGIQKKFRAVADKGNWKDFFLIQEIPQGQRFNGCIFNFDPFEYCGLDDIVIRVGLHRNGMLRLRKARGEFPVRLNAWTAGLFGRHLKVTRFLLFNIQLTPEMDTTEALEEVKKWVC